MNSMTGYGKGVSELEGRKLTIELKSVNHRFLDLNLKMPRLFNFAEETVRKNLKKAFRRGHIDIYVNYEDGRSERRAIKISEDLARQYADAAGSIAALCGIPNDFGAAAALKIPDVVSEVEREDDEAVLRSLVESAILEAQTNLVGMRKTEGGLLQKDLEAKIAAVQALASKVETRAPLVQADFRKKLEERMREVLTGVQVDEARLLNEVAFFADRSGIDEEITRLKSHLQHFLQLGKKDGAIGKEMDFIVQEMNREVNTIGSKCNDSEISALVVALKSEIENIREQIQNIE